MSNYFSSKEEGCFVLCVSVVLLVIIYFAMPWVCMLGWEPIAVAFNLPTFTYWNWFWMSWLIRWLFKSGSNVNLNKRQ